MPAAIAFDGLRRHSALFARLCLALGLALCVLAAVRLFWLLLAGPTLPVSDALPLAGHRASAAPTVADSVARWHLFGSAESLPEAVASAPETELRLFLRGTLNESVPEQGIAIVADAEGDERAYRVGEMLPGDARLLAVHAGRVLIERGGRREGLSLRSDLAPPARKGTAEGRLPGARAGGGTVPVYAEQQPFAPPKLNLGMPNLEQIRDASLPDVAELARQVGVLPVLENQRMVGVRLTVGRDSDLLERYGLRASDVITAVNDIPLDGPARQQELLDSLRGGRSVKLTVRRDGGTQELRLSH